MRISPASKNADSTGTVNIQLGGLARTDNSGWGEEFERLTERLVQSREPARKKDQ